MRTWSVIPPNVWFLIECFSHSCCMPMSPKRPQFINLNEIIYCRSCDLLCSEHCFHLFTVENGPPGAYQEWVSENDVIVFCAWTSTHYLKASLTPGINIHLWYDCIYNVHSHTTVSYCASCFVLQWKRWVIQAPHFFGQCYKFYGQITVYILLLCCE